MLTRVYIVIEPVFDSRADTEFHAGIKFLESFGKQMRR